MTYRFSLEDKEITVPTLQEVSERFVEARDRLGWTPKNLPKGIPVYDEHGAECAAIGINGRVWRSLDDWRSGIRPLFDPLPAIDFDFFSPRGNASQGSAPHGITTQRNDP